MSNIVQSFNMALPINFTPGPSQVYFTVEDHVRQAFREGIPSISHRSKQFEQHFRGCREGLTELLNLPAGWHVFFTSSATEVWERSLQNLVASRSHHFVNGAFSAKFHEFATLLGKQPTADVVAEGCGFDSINIPQDTELIAITQNETSTGVSVTPEWIRSIRMQYPQALIIVDGVSALPHLQPDFNDVDSVFFSVQKGFGLPAGLGVWMVNDRCLAVSENLRAAGHRTGTYHTLAALASNAKKDQTPSTPNVLGIYLLDQVIKDFLRRGINSIRQETAYKSALLYNCLEGHSLVNPFVQRRDHRSPTVVVANSGEHTKRLYDHLLAHGLQAGEGYGTGKKTQLRFANFPAHSKETYEQLCDLIAAFN